MRYSPTINKCVCRAHFENGIDRIVHLEAVSDEHDDRLHNEFRTVAALQRVAAARLPGLVRETNQIGVASNTERRRFEFSVMEFIDGITLEDAWGKMDEENRRDVVALAEALKQLHSISISNRHVQDILGKSVEGSLGGPLTGFCGDGLALLNAVHERCKLNKEPVATVDVITDPIPGCHVRSKFDDLRAVIIIKSDMDQWQHDCELAGFYPPSYKIALQDTYLGTANRHVSCYLLLKEQLRALAPLSASQAALLKAVELIFQSRHRCLGAGNNIPTHIRERFIDKMQLTQDAHAYLGWTRKSQDGPQPESSQEEAQELEHDAV